MALSIHKPEVSKKCGEISAAMFEDKNEFYLNCEFCECTYLQLNHFIQHMYDDHLAQLGLFKQETTTTPLYSSEAVDCYNLKCAVEEEDIDMLEARKESRDTDFVSNTFETVLLEPNDVEIKEECQQNIKHEDDMHTGRNEIHNAIDVTNDDKTIPGSDTVQKKSRTRKAQNKKIIKNSKGVVGKKTDDVADNFPQNKKISRKKTTQEAPLEFNDIDGTNIVVEATFDKTKQSTDQKDIRNTNDVTHDEKLASETETRQKKNKSRRKNSKSDTKPQAKHIKMTDSVIDVSQRIILAEIYKKHTCLWDEKKDITYHFNNRRAESLRSAREEFNNKTELNLTESDFSREIICMRKTCSNEKKQKIACRQESVEHKPSCTYYNYIEYLEDDVYPFVCSICGDQHRTLGKLKEHEATHDGSLPFKCSVCGRGFQVANYLTQHLRRHAHDLPFHCEVCNKAFITSTEVVIHMRTHTDERPFVCYMCGLKLKTSSALIEHIMRHEQDRRFKCEICSKGFVTPAQRREHRKIHKKERDYICDICQKAFKSRHQLKQHKLIHDSVKSYVCKICEKRFAQYTGLNVHMKSHGTTLPTLTKNTIHNHLIFNSPP